MNAINSTLEKLNSPSINLWHNTDAPLPLDKIQQYIYTWKKVDTSFEDSQVHVLERDRWFKRGVKEAIHAK